MSYKFNTDVKIEGDNIISTYLVNDKIVYTTNSSVFDFINTKYWNDENPILEISYNEKNGLSESKIMTVKNSNIPFFPNKSLISQYVNYHGIPFSINKKIQIKFKKVNGKYITSNIYLKN